MSALLEDNLAFLDDAADRVLAAIEEQRTGTAAAANAYHRSPQQTTEPVQRSARAGSRQRCSSAPRSRSVAADAGGSVSGATSGGFTASVNTRGAASLYDLPINNNRSTSPEPKPAHFSSNVSGALGLDKKIDLLMKKHKYVEDRLKKIEKDNETNGEIARQAQEAAEALTAAQKSDKKTIVNLRTQLAAMRSRLDVMTAGVLPVLPHAVDQQGGHFEDPGIGDERSTPSAWKDLIQRTVKAEMTRAMGELLAKCSSEQAKVCAQYYEKMQQSSQRGGAGMVGNENQDIFNRSAGVEQFSSMQREIVRVVADIDRVKLRQAQFDTSLQELKSGSTSRLLKAEELRKKAHKAQRAEVEEFLNRSQRKMNEMTTALKRDSAEMQELKEELKSCVQRSGHALAEHDARLQRHDQSKEELYSEMERLLNASDALQQRVDNADRTLEVLLKNSADATAATDLVRLQAEKLDILDEKVTALREDCNIAAGVADDSAPRFDTLANLIDRINEKFEARTDALKERLDACTAQIAESNKKTTSRIKDVVESIASVFKLKQSLEEVLQEADSRNQSDAQWAYKLHAGLQKQELAFAELFTEFAAVKQSVNSKVDNDKVDRLEQVLTARIDANEQRWEEAVASSLGTHAQQLKDDIQQRVDELRGQLRLETREMLQDHNAQVADTFTRLSDALTEISAIQDQLLIDHEDSSRFNAESLNSMKGKVQEMKGRLEAVEKLAEDLQTAREGQQQQLERVQQQTTGELSALAQGVKVLEGKLDDQISQNNETLEKIESSSVHSSSVQEMQHTVNTELHQMKQKMRESERLIQSQRKIEQEAFDDIKTDLKKQNAELQIQAEQLAALLSLQDATENMKENLRRIEEKADSEMKQLQETVTQLAQQVEESSTTSSLSEAHSNAVEGIKTSIATVSQDLLELVRDVDTRLRADVAESKRAMSDLKKKQSAHEVTVREQLSAQARTISSQESFFRERLASTEEKLSVVEEFCNRYAEEVKILQEEHEAIKEGQEKMATEFAATQAIAAGKQDSEESISLLEERLKVEMSKLLMQKADTADLEVLQSQIESKASSEEVAALQLSLDSFSGNMMELSNDIQSQLRALEQAVKSNDENKSAALEERFKSFDSYRDEMKDSMEAAVKARSDEVLERTKASVSKQLEAWGTQLEELMDDTSDKVKSVEENVTAIEKDKAEFKLTVGSSEKKLNELVAAVDLHRRAMRDLKLQVSSITNSGGGSGSGSGGSVGVMRSPSTEERVSTYQQMLVGVSKFEEVLHRLDAVVSGNTEKIASLEVDLGGLKRDLKPMFSDFVGRTDNLAERLADLTGLEDRVAELGDKLTRIDETIEQRVIATQPNAATPPAPAVDDTGPQLENMRNALRSLDDEVKQLRAEITSQVVEAASTIKSEMITPLNTQLSSIEERHAADMKSIRMSCEKVQQELASTHTEITERIERAEVNIHATINIMEDLRASTVQVEEESSGFSSRIGEMRAAVAEQREQLQAMEESIEQSLAQQTGRFNTQISAFQQKISNCEDSDRARGQRLVKLEQRVFQIEAASKEKMTTMTNMLDAQSHELNEKMVQSGQLAMETSRKLQDLEEIFAGFDEAKKVADEQVNGRLSALELETTAHQEEFSRQVEELNELCQSLVKATEEDIGQLASRVELLEARLPVEEHDSDDAEYTPWHVTEELAIALDEIDSK